MPLGSRAKRRQLLDEEVDAGVDFGDDLVQRRFRRQRVADQRHIDAMGHRAFGNDGENLFRPAPASSRRG